MGDLVYTGGLGYFAQLQTINRMLSQQSQSKGMTLIGYGSYGYEPKLKQGVLAIPQAILPGGMGTNMRVIDTSITVNGSSINFTMGMNSSMLESGISEQLFCNEEMNPDNKPCYGISTASGLAMAQQQGQKIYQITAKNKDQLKNVGMSGEEMSKEIYQAINAGGVVILPEKAVDGSGRNAIYVYYVSNPATGFTAWKISGGLNGGTFNISADSFMKLTKGFLSIAAGSVEDAIIFLIKQILSYSSKLMKKILKFFYIFELGKHCFDDPDIGNLGAFFAGFICWFLQYGIAILIGAFIGFSFTGLLGLFVAIIMAVIIAEIIRLLTFGKLEQCQQWALARCKAI